VEEGLARGGGGLVVRHADGVQLSDASEAAKQASAWSRLWSLT
jgi:hypothetical protein